MAKEVIQLRDVSKTYLLGQIKVQALKKISLSIQEGEFTALVGASGSGKSTLLNIIGCIDDPSEGEVFLQAQKMNELSDNSKSDLRNQNIGFIFQSFNLVPVLDVYENVELPLLINPKIMRSERKQRVMESVRDVGLESVMHHRPDQLSGGQRQRVAIARALSAHPALVLADEPTANLDSSTSQKILDLMLELNQKRKITFLFSTHDERVMKQVTRVLTLKDGELQ